MRVVSPARLLHDVGRRIAELRALSGVTQAQLAELLSVSTRYVQRVEGGRENLTLTTVAAIADALQVTAAEFFVRPTQPKPKVGRPKKSPPSSRTKSS